jgi:hypothetical protein
VTNILHHRIPFKSAILTDFPTIFEECRTKQWTLLYRGTHDGFKSSAFHRKCDNQPNTITIILTTKGFIFGGFTPVAWESPKSGQYKPDSTQKSFVFSLKNARNSEARKFSISNSPQAIDCNSSYGPIFGSGHDINLASGCNGNNSCWTNLGGSYMNDTGIDGKQVFTGEQCFTVKGIEIFSISLEINCLEFAIFQCSEWNSALIEMLSESNQSVIRRFSHCTIAANCDAKVLPRGMNA